MSHSPSNRLFVATRKGLFTLERAAAGWKIAQTAFLGDPLSIVHIDPAGRIYAALDLGHFGNKLQRSTDGGATWEERAAPAYPEKPADVDDRDANGKSIPWKLQKIWALADAGTDQATESLWCGTLPGGLFRSDDGGASWQLNRPLWDKPERKGWFGGGYDWPGIHSVCVDPRNAQRVLIAISCGGVWLTEDGGASWRAHADGMRAEYMPPERAYDPNIQDPHIMVASREHPDALWVQHHNGIFRSTDGAASWQEIKDIPPVPDSASPPRSIRTIPKPPGSSPRSRTKSASRSTANWSSYAPATAARASKSSTAACRKATPTI